MPFGIYPVLSDNQSRPGTENRCGVLFWDGVGPGVDSLKKRGDPFWPHSFPKNDRMNGYISMICWLATSS
jgi:hypothetical protein